MTKNDQYLAISKLNEKENRKDPISINAIGRKSEGSGIGGQNEKEILKQKQSAQPTALISLSPTYSRIQKKNIPISIEQNNKSSANVLSDQIKKIVPVGGKTSSTPTALYNKPPKAGGINYLTKFRVINIIYIYIITNQYVDEHRTRKCKIYNSEF